MPPRPAHSTAADPSAAALEPGSALTVTGLVKRYGDRTVVDGLGFNAARGALTAVLGPNGAGKTTTIECCEGLRRPDGGTIEVLGLPPEDPRLRERVGVMLQDGGLPTGVRAVEMLEHVAAMYADPRPVPELVERLGLGSFARTTVRRLSGGQRQRLALAAAVVGRPELVFLDEPSAGMDPQSRHAVWELIEELRADGVGVVLTTHLMDEAEALADHVVVVDHGAVIAQGTVPELTGAAADGSTSTLRWSTTADLPLEVLRARLTELREPARGGVPGDADPWSLSVTAPGRYAATGPVDTAAVATLTAWCAEQDALVTELTVDRRSLEDVFLDLTGRSLR